MIYPHADGIALDARGVSENLQPDHVSLTLRAALSVNAMNSMKRYLLRVLIPLFVASSSVAGDWPCWRGPRLDGTSDETGWLSQWPEAGPPVAWKTDVGTGFSSVTVGAGRLYTIGNRDNTDTVYCLDAAAGRQLWTHAYPCPLDANLFEGGPTSTPTIDADRVYVLSRQGDLFCFDAATGAVRWSKNIAEESAVRVPGWGFAGSPLVRENLLLVNVGEAGAAVDKTTGKLVWTSADADAGYNTPVPARCGDRQAVVFASGKFYHAVEIATGKKLWEHRWLTRFGCNAADAIVDGDRVFISSGYNRGAAVLDISGHEPAVVWANKEMQNQLNSSVLIDGRLYGFDGNTHSETKLKCMDFASGEVRWTHDWKGMGSLTAAGGKLILLGEQGELTVAEASPEGFKPTARAQVLTGKCWTVPVLAQGRIYCRNAEGRLVAVDVRVK